MIIKYKMNKELIIILIIILLLIRRPIKEHWGSVGH